MLLENGEVYGAVQGLVQLIEKDLPVTPSYWVARLLDKFDGPNKAIDKVRDGLVKKHGKPNKEKSGRVDVQIGSVGWDSFTTDYNELMTKQTEVDISPVVIPIKVPKEIDGKELVLKPNIILSLKKFVEIEGLEPFGEDPTDLIEEAG